MKHFLITRFNLISENWEKEIENPKAISDDWLNTRFEIFEKWCLPSVINQRNKDFTWLILFDTRTPANYLNRINRYNEIYSNINTLFINGFEALNPEVKKFISADCQHLNNNEFIVTTRFDNDDLLHEDFIDEIQSLMVPQHNSIIDLKYGYQLDIQKANFELRSYSQNLNPFISLIESLSKFETVVSKNHNDFKKYKRILPKSDKALWIQLIHSTNKLNMIFPYLTLKSGVDFTRFGLDEGFSVDNQNIYLKNLINFPQRWFYKIKVLLKEKF